MNPYKVVAVNPGEDRATGVVVGELLKGVPAEWLGFLPGQYPPAARAPHRATAAARLWAARSR